MMRLSSVVARASRPCLLLLALASLLLAGCETAPKPQTFTIAAAPQLAAQADLATTANTVAEKIRAEGTKPQSGESVFLAEATAAWKSQTGPGKPVAVTAEAVAAEFAKMTAAKVAAEAAAETEKIAHLAQLKKLNDAIGTIEAALEAEKVKTQKALDAVKAAKADADLSAMWGKLWAILLAGGAAMTCSFLFAPLRPAAPLVGIGFAGLAAAVVVKACAGDVIWVLVIGGVLAVIYVVLMWILSACKAAAAQKIVGAATDAVEALPPEVAPAVKAAIKNAAVDAGVQPQLSAILVDKGYSKGGQA